MLIDKKNSRSNYWDNYEKEIFLEFISENKEEVLNNI